MSLISRITTWTVQQILTSSALNGEFNNVVNVLNNLDSATTSWTNVKTAALIATGTSTNDNAASGIIGEVITATTARGSPVALTTTVSANVLSGPVSLTAGDWNVSFTVGFKGGSSTSTSMIAGLSTTSATLPGLTAACTPDSNGQVEFLAQGINIGSGDYCINSNVFRVSITSTQTLYLVANATFSAGAVSAYGYVLARRAR